MRKMPLLVNGHALRWKQDPVGAAELRSHGYEPKNKDSYDPFNPKGPWTMECECGYSRQVVTRAQGRALHDAHKLLEQRSARSER